MVKQHDSIPAINDKFKFNSKINISSVNIYNALFLYPFLCLCESTFPVVMISSLAMLSSYRPGNGLTKAGALKKYKALLKKKKKGLLTLAEDVQLNELGSAKEVLMMGEKEES